MNIDRVKIKNFKSLKDINISLSNLTLITGVNSSGKSSFIQTLLLLKQNQDNIKKDLMKFLLEHLLKKHKKDFLNESILAEDGTAFILNGNYIELGDKSDILYEESSYTDDIIIIEISNEKINLEVHFNEKLGVKYNSRDASPNDIFNINLNANLFLDDMQYICTDRISPMRTYPLSDINIKNNLIGFRGEYTAHFLAEYKNENIFIQELKHPSSITNQYLENTSLWLNEISQNIDIYSTVNPTQQNVLLEYSYKYKDGRTAKYSPLNIGFGITYVLPIIVSILKAKEGDLVIIENPESHLHPAGQSKIAELCAIASANGVQIIIETHSDHFLNGIRVATKKGLLMPEQSKVYYFRKEKDKLETIIDEINIDGDGGIDRYPKGFFDQFDDDLDELLGL